VTLRFARYGKPGFGADLKLNLDKSPAPAVMALGIAAGRTDQYRIWDDGADTYRPDMTKPPYRVPLMSEIRTLPWNGLTVASTFAGGGGSSTGYRMAGYKVVWANELTQSARDSYAANMAPGTILDGRDIRTVQAADILAATGLAAGELDVFDGSPPCVSFSTAGKREKGWGRVTTSHDATQRQDDLFYEYARLLQGLQPRAFIAENVSGLIKGTAKGYFLEILRALRACGYRVEAKLLDAQWLGVPQMRQRLIFQGIRADIDAMPAWPVPLAYRYTVRDALPWIGTERRKFTIAELKRICGFPDDYVLTGSYADQWARCGNAVPPVMMSHIATALAANLSPIKIHGETPT
jgi:DNA (cytosine-5)-methyltransferase 1